MASRKHPPSRPQPPKFKFTDQNDADKFNKNSAITPRSRWKGIKSTPPISLGIYLEKFQSFTQTLTEEEIIPTGTVKGGRQSK